MHRTNSIGVELANIVELDVSHNLIANLSDLRNDVVVEVLNILNILNASNNQFMI